MKNITLSVDEETHPLARSRAAELDTSVSALVRDFLKNLVEDRSGGPADKRLEVETEVERRRRMLREVIERCRTTSPGFRAADNLPREEVYDHAKSSAEAQAGAAEDEDRKRG